MEYTIRDCETGAVQVTGITANTPEEAEAEFFALFPNYDGEVYAAESGWND